MLTVYLAGPEVFLPDAIEVGERKKRLCSAYGFEGIFPLDNEIVPKASSERIDRLIYRANEAMIRRAHFGICNLTPFRGVSADPGTVFEVGMLAGLGKRVFAYTNVAPDYFDRTKRTEALAFDSGQKLWRDTHGMTVEDFGNADNLMIDWAVAERGGYPIVRHDARPMEIDRDLTGFERCLRLAAEAFARPA
ncbi:nucleoside 2-deoxyribosyltransferase [Rhodoplanes sp. Z2-YC6860]|uniref:nucleoside 2-deoxyribosyltransferase n=1 Tax=Rhodoplanes sp. Z2-YC6860 TaxID=674703 RepID=UPI00078CBC9A|nr:nucleoside 2-deoxyribosyltransferase [Rhodoplanes sp. Z2-YC6860]AMN41349.1 nucleoside 2-deoxyribosyltransferase [Rhodoplanes sp. Z2-YC6860]